MRHAPKNYTWFAGIGGQGKTLAMRALYRARIAAGGSGIFIDPNHRNGDLGAVFSRVEDLPRVLRRRPFSAVYQSAYGDDPSALWPILNRIGHLLLAVDEAGAIAASDACDKGFLELVRVGRNQGVDITATFQAPSDLHPRIRQQADVWISFRQAEPDYARTMEAKFFRAKGAAAALLKLPKLHYFRATLEGGFQDVSGGTVPCPTCGPLPWLHPHRAGCPLGK